MTFLINTYQLEFTLVVEYVFDLDAVGARALHEHVEEDLDDLLAHEGQRPREDIHVVRQNERVLGVVVLLDLNLVVLKAKDSRFVIIYVAVIRCAEDSDY